MFETHVIRSQRILVDGSRVDSEIVVRVDEQGNIYHAQTPTIDRPSREPLPQ